MDETFGRDGQFYGNTIMGHNQVSEDKVNHPKHYNNSPAHCTCGRRLECIDISRHMNFNIGNTIKYIWRFRDKNGLEDLKKARWHLDDEIKQMESKDVKAKYKQDSLDEIDKKIAQLNKIFIKS